MKTETFKFDFNFQKCAQDEINLFFYFLGILVVQLKWRGKTFFGTLLSQDKCDR